MNNQELISIIIPIYNVEKFLDRCIKSVIAQTYTNIQIILVDDGSPDMCPEMCDYYAKLDKRIEVIHKKNGGLSDARNAGLHMAKGEWVTFIDSDDMISNSFIESLYKTAIDNKCDIAMCKFKSFEDQIPNNIKHCNNVDVVSSENMLNRIYGTNHKSYLETIVTWNKIYRKALFNEIRFPYGRIHEDEATTYKLLYFAKNIAIINEELYFYYQNPSGIMKRQFNVNRLDYLDALRERYNFFDEKGLDILADKTAKLLYIYIQDYASLNKVDVKDYDIFISLLKSKYRKIRPILIKSNFKIKDKIRIYISYLFFGALTLRI